jgi:hypothetical protein
LERQKELKQKKERQQKEDEELEHHKEKIKNQEILELYR